MSINRDMKEYTLQQNIPAQTESGAGKQMWKNIRKIQVAVYKKMTCELQHRKNIYNLLIPG